MTASPVHSLARHDAIELLSAFAVALRNAGVGVTVDRSQAFP